MKNWFDFDHDVRVAITSVGIFLIFITVMMWAVTIRDIFREPSTKKEMYDSCLSRCPSTYQNEGCIKRCKPLLEKEIR